MTFLKYWGISLCIIQLFLHICRSFCTELSYALISRLIGITFMEYGLLLGGWFIFTTRLNRSSLNVSCKMRFTLKMGFVILAFLSHSVYIFFYVEVNPQIANLCFGAFAFYVHLLIFSLILFLIEKALKIAFPDKIHSSGFFTTLGFSLSLILFVFCLLNTQSAPVVKAVDVQIKNLPHNFHGFSIALITDVHIGPTVSIERVENIVQIVNDLKVDATAISGDLIDGYLHHIRSKAMPLKNLKSKYGNFYATGNHEYYHGNINDLLKFLNNNLSFTVLHNTHFLIEKNGSLICFSGVDDFKSTKLLFNGHKMDAEKALKGCPKESTTVLLAHQPNAAHTILTSIRRKVDLVLAGHTHAGQLYPLMPMSYFLNKYYHGLYRFKDSQIYVSAGVHFWGPPMALGISSVRVVILFLISCFGGAYIIKYIGSKTISDLNGYEIGNRLRTIAVLRLLWLMAHFSYPIYVHLFSAFKSNKEDKYQSLSVPTKNAKSRQRALIVFWFVIINAHLCYAYYILNNPVPWIFFEISALCTGLWLHLVFFSFAFLSINFIIDCLKLVRIGQSCVNLLFSSRLLKRIFNDNRTQVQITLCATIFLSFIQYIASDRVIVKETQFSFRKWPSSEPPMRFAMLSDLHCGGSVYSKQIDKVVDMTNNLNVDAVLIVGDTIDAPRSWIEDRTLGLKNLRSKYGTYLITGNHEAVNLGPFCLVGLNDLSSKRSGISNHFMNASVIGNCSVNSAIVVLAHNPASVPKILKAANETNRHVDLILSGHTHAAQYYVIVPFVYWLLPYFYGLYSINAGTTQLLVSAGTLYQAAPMKMPYMSEIWLITLGSA